MKLFLTIIQLFFFYLNRMMIYNRHQFNIFISLFVLDFFVYLLLLDINIFKFDYLHSFIITLSYLRAEKKIQQYSSQPSMTSSIIAYHHYKLISLVLSLAAAALKEDCGWKQLYRSINNPRATLQRRQNKMKLV